MEQYPNSAGRRGASGTRFLVLVLSLLLCTGISAATIQYTFTTSEQDPAYTWNTVNEALPLFNGTLGTLTQVDITMTAYVEGNIGLENTTVLGGNTVTGTLSTTLTLTRGGSTLLTQSVSATASEVFPQFDGTEDYDGLSGTTFLNRQGAAAVTFSTTNPTVLDTYIDSAVPPLAPCPSP